MPFCYQIPSTPEGRRIQLPSAGVFDYYQSIFRADEADTYTSRMGEGFTHTAKGKVRTRAQQLAYYRTYWRTHQMSDHLPMWVELKADRSFLALQKELALTEDRIAAARRFYNGNARTLNVLRESIPTNLIAALMSVEPAGFFKLDQAAERVVPRVEDLLEA